MTLDDHSTEISESVINNANGRKKFLGTKFSLRGHLSPITNIECFYIPSTFSFKGQDKSDETSYQLLETTLISGDESGWVFWWDLNTRRPIGSWKAHDGPILSIIQTGLTWLRISGDHVAPQINSIHFGKLLTHGRDGEIKVWDVFNFIKSENGYGFIWRNSCPLQRKIFTPRDDITKWPLPKIVFQMPVNMLNFSNVDLLSNILITPGTQDPNTFDVYDVYPVENGDYKLTRLFKAVDPLELIKKQHLGLDIRQNCNSESPERNFGVIMKFAWIDSGLFAVGYESGDVITYVIENDAIRIGSVNSVHYPNPVLSLNYDVLYEKLLVGSSSAKVSISTLDAIKSKDIDITDKTEIFDTRHKGVSVIAVKQRLLSLLTWNGYSRFYKYDGSQVLNFLFKVRSTKSSIQNSENSTSVDNDSDPSGPSIVCFNKPQLAFSFLEKTNALQYNNGRAKNIIRHRAESALDSSWLFTGYKNGRLSMQSIETSL